MAHQVIKAPIDNLRDSAEKLKTYTDQNEDLFSQILNMVNSVESCGDWQGKSMKTLQNVTQRNQKKFEAGMQELCELAGFLQKYAEAMSAKDEELMKRINDK